MKIFYFFALILLFPLFVFAGQGCCSWHKGECGCSSGGRTVCCDGTLSPSCTCNYVAPTPTPKPTPKPITPAPKLFTPPVEKTTPLSICEQNLTLCKADFSRIEKEQNETKNILQEKYKEIPALEDNVASFEFFIFLFIIGVPTISFFAYNRKEKEWFEWAFWICFVIFAFFAYFFINRSS